MTAEHPLVTAYREFSPNSAKIAERARKVFPGGDTRSSAHYGPYPLAMTGGEGCVLVEGDMATVQADPRVIEVYLGE